MDSAGFLTQHMVAHILAMNVVAPLIVLAWQAYAGTRAQPSLARWIAPATTAKIALLWIWHLPAPLAYAHAFPAAMVAMHVSLFAAALWFWRSVLDEAEASRWRALSALLVTGKLFCLLGALLTFAPRALFVRAAEIHMGGGLSAGALMPDQQLAGLIMLVACPLTYVLAGVVIAARWLRDIERRDPTYQPEGSG